jgi:hypothetical protein
VDLSGAGYGPVVGSCDHDNESSGLIQDKEFIDQLGDYTPVKDSAPLSYYHYHYYIIIIIIIIYFVFCNIFLVKLFCASL